MEIDQVVDIPPDLQLAPFSQAEYDRLPAPVRLQMVKKSDNVWALTTNGEVVIVVGVMVPALVSQPEMWFLLCDAFTRNLRRNLLELRELVEKLLDIYPSVLIRVDADYPAGKKFALFMGFKELSYTVSADGKEYGVYEVKR